MRNLKLTVKDIGRLDVIQKNLSNNKSISLRDKIYLSTLLSQFPTPQSILVENIPLSDTFEVQVWDTRQLEVSIKKWIKLFAQTPGWDYTSFCYMVVREDKSMLGKNVIAIAQFAPSMSHNLDLSKNGYEVWLKDDGYALFQLPTLEDAEKYPELYNFKGTWKEAYVLLIETLKKGWPMEEFPEELKPFLKK